MNRRTFCQSIAVVGLAVGGANRATAVDKPSSICGQMISLGLNETVTTEGGITVRLSGLKDHRCSTDVECVWAGYAEIWLELSGPEWEQYGYPATEYITVGMDDTGVRRYGSFVMILDSLSPTLRKALDTPLDKYEISLVLLDLSSPPQTG